MKTFMKFILSAATVASLPFAIAPSALAQEAVPAISSMEYIDEGDYVYNCKTKEITYRPPISIMEYEEGIYYYDSQYGYMACAIFEGETSNYNAATPITSSLKIMETLVRLKYRIFFSTLQLMCWNRFLLLPLLFGLI